MILSPDPILDGYTRQATILAGEADCVLEYRPMVRKTAEYFLQRLKRFPSEIANRIACQSLAQKIVSWNGTALLDSGSLFELLKSDPKAWTAIFQAICGVDPVSTEHADTANLQNGARLRATNPGLANVSCDFCKKWWFNPLDLTVYHRGGKPVRRTEEPLLCETRQGCPKGSPEKPYGLSEKNNVAFEHYLECKATNQFPDDAIVKQNARVIASILP